MSQRIQKQVHQFQAPASIDWSWEETPKPDVTLVCGNDEFLVHKTILSTNSTHLQTLLREGFEDVMLEPLPVSGVHPAAMDVVLHYMYSKKIDGKISLDVLVKTYEAARLLDLQYLVKDILNHFSKYRFYSKLSMLNNSVNSTQYLSKSSINTLWDLAEKYSDSYLLNEVRIFVESKLYPLTENDVLSTLTYDRVISVVRTALKNKKLSQAEILKCLCDWVKYDEADRSQYLKLFSELLCLDKIPIYFIRNQLPSIDSQRQQPSYTLFLYLTDESEIFVHEINTSSDQITDTYLQRNQPSFLTNCPILSNIFLNVDKYIFVILSEYCNGQINLWAYDLMCLKWEQRNQKKGKILNFQRIHQNSATVCGDVIYIAGLKDNHNDSVLLLSYDVMFDKWGKAVHYKQQASQAIRIRHIKLTVISGSLYMILVAEPFNTIKLIKYDFQRKRFFPFSQFDRGPLGDFEVSVVQSKLIFWCEPRHNQRRDGGSWIVYDARTCQWDESLPRNERRNGSAITHVTSLHGNHSILWMIGTTDERFRDKIPQPSDPQRLMSYDVSTMILKQLSGDLSELGRLRMLRIELNSSIAPLNIDSRRKTSKSRKISLGKKHEVGVVASTMDVSIEKIIEENWETEDTLSSLSLELDYVTKQFVLNYIQEYNELRSSGRSNLLVRVFGEAALLYYVAHSKLRELHICGSNLWIVSELVSRYSDELLLKKLTQFLESRLVPPTDIHVIRHASYDHMMAIVKSAVTNRKLSPIEGLKFMSDWIHYDKDRRSKSLTSLQEMALQENVPLELTAMYRISTEKQLDSGNTKMLIVYLTENDVLNVQVIEMDDSEAENNIQIRDPVFLTKYPVDEDLASLPLVFLNIGRYLYVIQNDNNFQMVTWTYDLHQLRWECKTSTSPNTFYFHKLRHLSGTVINGIVFVVGIDVRCEKKVIVARFDPDTSEWSHETEYESESYIGSPTVVTTQGDMYLILSTVLQRRGQISTVECHKYDFVKRRFKRMSRFSPCSLWDYETSVAGSCICLLGESWITFDVHTKQWRNVFHDDCETYRMLFGQQNLLWILSHECKEYTEITTSTLSVWDTTDNSLRQIGTGFQTAWLYKMLIIDLKHLQNQ